MKKTLLLSCAIVASLATASAQSEKEILWFDSVSTVKVKPVLVLKTTKGATAKRNFSFGTYKELDRYAVDFGDGNLVLSDSVKHESSSASVTSVSGNALGDSITLYANDSVYYLSTSLGDTILSADVSGLKNVQTLSLGTNQLTTFDATGLDSLTSLTLFNGKLQSINVSNNPKLRTLSVAQNQLTALDVSNNQELEQLTAYTNRLTTLDISKNTKLSNVPLNDNQLTSITLPETETLTTLNVSNNQLVELALEKLPNLKTLYANNNRLTTLATEGLTKLNDIYLNNNQLTTITLAKAKCGNVELEGNRLTSISIKDASKSCKLAKNALTLATLPTKPASLSTKSKIKKFTYAPQDALSVDSVITTNDVLDLSAQKSATGILDAPAATSYSFATADGTALVEGTDYKVVEEGKFQFLKAQSGIHGIMANEAFPLFTGASAFVTTAFSVSVPTGITNVSVDDNNNGRIYNVNGVEVSTPRSGIYIKNGKKFVVK